MTRPTLSHSLDPALNDINLPAERELRTRRPPAVFDVHDESEKRASLRVRVSVGDQERLQIDQTVHGRHNVEALRTPVLLLRVRVPLILDLASGRPVGTGAVDR